MKQDDFIPDKLNRANKSQYSVKIAVIMLILKEENVALEIRMDFGKNGESQGCPIYLSPPLSYMLHS